MAFDPETAPHDPYSVVAEANPKTILRVRELRAPYHSLIIEALDPDFMLRIVLVAGQIGDYVAYIGIGPPDWVRDCGNKLSFEQARGFFPGIDERRYRQE